jgi:hypothetical protein
MTSILLRLPDHLHTLLISTVSFAVVHHLAAPEFARFLLGKKAWDALSVRERVGWCVVIRPLVCVRADRKSLGSSPFRQSHVASLVHALLILPLAASCLHIPALAADRAFGWDPRVGTLFAVTSG